MLVNLPLQDVDKAFQFLADPLKENPPEELSHLSLLEWNALSHLLRHLYEERKHHRVQ